METNNSYLDLTDILNLDQLTDSLTAQKGAGGGCSNANCPGAGDRCTNGTCI
jgi:hypothetical protein